MHAVPKDMASVLGTLHASSNASVRRAHEPGTAVSCRCPPALNLWATFKKAISELRILSKPCLLLSRMVRLALFSAALLGASTASAAYKEKHYEPFKVSMWHEQKEVSRYGTKYKVVSPKANPLGGSLRFVENSGVCETTAGVYQVRDLSCPRLFAILTI
jgi:hypothetical protein